MADSIAGRRTARNSMLALAVVGIAVAVIGVAGRLLHAGAAWQWDDVHWTGAAVAAACLAAWGWLAAARPDRHVRLGFAIGMGLWLLGQLAWDLQSVTGDPRVHTIADGLYLVSAVPVLVVLIRSLGGKASRSETLSAQLDTVAIFLAVLAAIVLYVGWRAGPSVSASDLAVPLMYPILFFAVPAAGVASLIATGRHPGVLSKFGFLVAYSALGIAWLGWVEGTITTTDSGPVVAVLFSAALIASGALAAVWAAPVGLADGVEAYRIAALLPVPSVVICLLVLLAAPSGNPLAPLPQIAASLSVVLGVVRQTLLLRERTRFVRRERTQVADQRRLLAVNEELLRTASAGPVLDVIADTLRSVVPYDTLTIYLADADRTSLEPVLARDRYADRILETPIPWGTGLTGAAVAAGEALLVNDAGNDPRGTRIPGTPADRESLIVAPLRSPDGPLGTLNLYRIERDFQPEELELVRLYASQAAIAFETANRHGRLSLAARSDPLTGLLNRSAFLKVVDELLERRGSAVAAILFLDLDGFKLVNDGLGHGAGDELLRRVADRLRSGLRPADAIGRIGGDEFAVAALVGSADEAGSLARRLLGELRAPILLGDVEIQVRASLGIGTSDFASDRESIMRDADAAMYEAKAGGKDRYALFRPELHERALARLSLEREMRAGLERDEFVLHFQPVVDLRSGAIAGHEALARWHHPVRGLTGPGAFIPMAEESGLIVPLGAFALRSGVAQLAALHRDGWSGWMSINLSPRQLRDPQLPGLICSLLDEFGLAADRLRLEITESEAISDEAGGRAALEAIAGLGVGLALDDFGTGYSSLERAAQLPLTVLKLDRSFVAAVNRDRVQYAVAQATISFAHALGVPVVAEGVETRDQEETLARLGCDFGQGYLYGRPAPTPRVSTTVPAAINEPCERTGTTG